jgi:hypothetical protein
VGRVVVTVGKFLSCITINRVVLISKLTFRRRCPFVARKIVVVVTRANHLSRACKLLA